MSTKVHFYDRRNGERKVASIDTDWWGPFQWAAGNYRCDCNRSRYMYGQDSDQISCAAINLILVEKIVRGDEIVYQEVIRDMSPRLVAILWARERLLALDGMATESREPGELEKVIEQVSERKSSLSAIEDTAAFVALCDQSIASGNKIAAYEADKNVVLDVAAEWDKLRECVCEFNELADEASLPFVESENQK
jgi:hypothetical protein